MRRDAWVHGLHVKVGVPSSNDFTRMTLAFIAHDEGTLWPQSTKSDARSNIESVYIQRLACHLLKNFSPTSIPFALHSLLPSMSNTQTTAIEPPLNGGRSHSQYSPRSYQ